MGYCAVEDVVALNPKRTYNSSSTPTSTQLETFIDFIGAQIDVILMSLGYSGTVTAPAEFVTVLKFLNALGAGALAEHAMFPETTEKGSTPHAAVLQTQYEKGLARLKAGEIPYDLAKPDLQNIGGYYSEMADQDDFPEPAFRKREEDLRF